MIVFFFHYASLSLTQGRSSSRDPPLETATYRHRQPMRVYVRIHVWRHCEMIELIDIVRFIGDAPPSNISVEPNQKFQWISPGRPKFYAVQITAD